MLSQTLYNPNSYLSYFHSHQHHYHLLDIFDNFILYLQLLRQNGSVYTYHSVSDIESHIFQNSINMTIDDLNVRIIAYNFNKTGHTRDGSRIFIGGTVKHISAMGKNGKGKMQDGCVGEGSCPLCLPPGSATAYTS